MSHNGKSGAESLAMPAIVVLVGLAAFGLGRLSTAELSTLQETAPIPHTYVGSRTGSVYYLPTCKGAQNIKEDNKVWFASRADAEAAGYKASATCAGL